MSPDSAQPKVNKGNLIEITVEEVEEKESASELSILSRSSLPISPQRTLYLSCLNSPSRKMKTYKGLMQTVETYKELFEFVEKKQSKLTMEVNQSKDLSSFNIASKIKIKMTSQEMLDIH
jgi:hypothetical protein